MRTVAADISGLYYDTAGQFSLETQVPLMDRGELHAGREDSDWRRIDPGL